MSEHSPLLQCDDLCFGYQRDLMPPLKWQVQAKEHWTIIGDNGCGKTTLFRTLLGFLSPRSGQYQRSEHSQYIAQVDRDSFDLPARVCDVIETGIERQLSFLYPFYRRKAAKKMVDLLQELELDKLNKRQFAELSQGEKQRVYLARCLISQPKLVFLDESTSAMDQRHSQQYFQVLQRYVEEREAAVISISHHLHASLQSCTHVLAFEDNQFAIGSKEERQKLLLKRLPQNLAS